MILEYFPKEVDRLIEPFAGSAAVSIAAAMDSRAKSYAIADSLSPLMGIWRLIIEQPDQLCDQYEQLWNEQLGNEKEYFNQVREEFNASRKTSPRSSSFCWLVA